MVIERRSTASRARSRGWPARAARGRTCAPAAQLIRAGLTCRVHFRPRCKPASRPTGSGRSRYGSSGIIGRRRPPRLPASRPPAIFRLLRTRRRLFKPLAKASASSIQRPAPARVDGHHPSVLQHHPPPQQQRTTNTLHTRPNSSHQFIPPRSNQQQRPQQPPRRRGSRRRSSCNRRLSSRQIIRTCRRRDRCHSSSGSSSRHASHRHCSSSSRHASRRSSRSLQRDGSRLRKPPSRRSRNAAPPPPPSPRPLAARPLLQRRFRPSRATSHSKAGSRRCSPPPSFARARMPARAHWAAHARRGVHDLQRSDSQGRARRQSPTQWRLRLARLL